MASNPQVVNTDITVTWDMVLQRIPRGTLIDVPAGSALLTALGSRNLTALSASRQSCDGGVSVGPFMENTVGGTYTPPSGPPSGALLTEGGTALLTEGGAYVLEES